MDLSMIPSHIPAMNTMSDSLPDALPSLGRTIRQYCRVCYKRLDYHFRIRKQYNLCSTCRLVCRVARGLRKPVQKKRIVEAMRGSKNFDRSVVGVITGYL